MEKTKSYSLIHMHISEMRTSVFFPSISALLCEDKGKKYGISPPAVLLFQTQTAGLSGGSVLSTPGCFYKRCVTDFYNGNLCLCDQLSQSRHSNSLIHISYLCCLCFSMPLSLHSLSPSIPSLHFSPFPQYMPG